MNARLKKFDNRQSQVASLHCSVLNGSGAPQSLLFNGTRGLLTTVKAVET